MGGDRGGRRGMAPAGIAARLGAVGLLAALAAAVSAPGAGGQEGEARVRVVHASPDAPPLDVYVDGEVVLEGLAFPGGSEFVGLPAGAHDLAVVPAGEDAGAALVEATVELEAGTAYDVAAVGPLADIAVEVYGLDLSAIAGGRARVRFVHAAPDAGVATLGLADGPPLFDGVDFLEDGGYLEFSPATYDLEIGFESGAEGAVVDVPGLTLEAGTVYDLYAVGLVEDGSLQALTLVAPVAASDEDTGDAVETAEATGVPAGDPGTTETGATETALPPSGVGTSLTGGGANRYVVGLLLLGALGAGWAAVRSARGVGAR
jgi:Domain of unknown function (DUF4397)